MFKIFLCSLSGPGLPPSILLYFYTFTAKSKKVVPQKSKIQITKYKIQEIVCHITHKSGLTTSSPCDTLYEEVFSVNSEKFPRDMFTFEAQYNVF